MRKAGAGQIPEQISIFFLLLSLPFNSRGPKHLRDFLPLAVPSLTVCGAGRGEDPSSLQGQECSITRSTPHCCAARPAGSLAGSLAGCPAKVARFRQVPVPARGGTRAVSPSSSSGPPAIQKLAARLAALPQHAHAVKHSETKKTVGILNLECAMPPCWNAFVTWSARASFTGARGMCTAKYVREPCGRICKKKKKGN